MFFKKKNLITAFFAISLGLFSVFGFFWGCGLPDPFEKNKPSEPTLSGYSDGKKIFLTISGDYSSSEFPNFSGIDLYLGDNNDLSEIKKRVLHISGKDTRPSLNVNLFTEEFPIKTELSGSFQFRLTSSAKESDLSDEGVSSATELIKNRANWTIDPGKIFYFAAKAITKKKESSLSEKIEISIPIEKTATIKYAEEHEIKVENSDGDTIKITFSSKENGQKVSFAYQKEDNSTNKSDGKAYVESLSMVSDTEWQKVTLPSKNFSKKDHVYGKNYIIFAQLQKNNKVNFYIKIFVEEVTTTHVNVIIHKFNKK